MLPPRKRLIQYLPPLFQEIQEFQKITAAEQQEANALWSEFDAAHDDLSILTATEQGLAKLERPLGVQSKATATPEERRLVLLARYNEQLPFTRRVLEQQLRNLCGPGGYTLTINPAAKTADVLVALTAKANFDEVAALLERVLPCNMVIVLGLKYNQHETLARFTHARLAARTHNELRNEVMA